MFDFETIKPFTQFRHLCDKSVFTALPDDWVVGLTDVVDSTAAIQAGRYKAVNMAGAAAISATINAFPDTSFPYSFGGDGAVVAVSGKDAPDLTCILQATRNWVAREHGLELRVAIVPIKVIRAAGHDVAVARFCPSDAVSYAMFSGGGVDWANEEMKAGRYQLDPDDEELWPDLTGLSCRWSPTPSRKGKILSLIVRKGGQTPWDAFNKAVDRLLENIDTLEREGHPVPEEGAGFTLLPGGLDLEAATRRTGSRFTNKIRVLLTDSFAYLLFVTGWKLGDFDPVRYRRFTALNSDYRKFEDGLRMTLDCDSATLDALKTLLEDFRKKGVLTYGLHVQDAAVMTCIVPSALTDRHFHFMDGFEGGYTQAARDLDMRESGQIAESV